MKFPFVLSVASRRRAKSKGANPSLQQQARHRHTPLYSRPPSRWVMIASRVSPAERAESITATTTP